MPVSAAVRSRLPDALPRVLTGGDDYELLLAVPSVSAAALREVAAMAGVPVTHIGGFTGDHAGAVAIDAAGVALDFAAAGWSHLG